MADPTLKSALHYCQQSKDLTDEDHAHLKRWLDWLDQPLDPVWDQIAAACRRHGNLSAYFEGPYSYIISAALRARHAAERAISPHLERELNQQRHQQECRELLGLADKIEEVIKEVRSPLAAFATIERPPRIDFDGGTPK